MEKYTYDDFNSFLERELESSRRWRMRDAVVKFHRATQQPDKSIRDFYAFCDTQWCVMEEDTEFAMTELMLYKLDPDLASRVRMASFTDPPRKWKELFDKAKLCEDIKNIFSGERPRKRSINDKGGNSRPPRKNGKSWKKQMEEGRCFRCNKRGHRARDCEGS